jgi:NtrC-family two-component system sensor histidine kinase KinB
VAGCLLVAATVGCGVWSVFTFLHLSAVVGETLKDSEETVDLTVTLADALEREDDALLLFLTGKEEPARQELGLQRRRFEATYQHLLPLMHDEAEQLAAANLRDHVETYRTLGDELCHSAGSAQSRYDSYHQRVNPALRKAVADCARIRALNFEEMKQAGVQARRGAQRSGVIVAVVSLAALALTAVVTTRLARSILRPVRELAASVDAIRRDDFGRRVSVHSADELGRLAEGFNRMAATLADYRESSLGELLLAKTTLEATLAALPDAIIVVNPDGQIVSKNPLAEEVLKAVGGAGASRIQDVPLMPQVLSAVEATLHGERTRTDQPDLDKTLTVSLDGRPHKILTTIAAIPEFLPRRCGVVVVLNDVTAFVRLDELRSELAAVASHELKTPLTALRMSLLLLQEREENLTPRQREVLAAAVLGGEELAATIDELLDLTRIEAGQLRLQQERVDLDALLEQTIQALRSRFEDAAIALRFHKDVEGAIVRGDAARLKIVFTNVLTNALKYVPPHGEVTVCLTSGPNGESSEKRSLRIAVTDTGPGIPAEFRERVFEKFFRVEHHRAERPAGVRGAGFGLYLCRQIIEAHGGKIWCESGENRRGTRIVMALETEQTDGVFGRENTSND